MHEDGFGETLEDDEADTLMIRSHRRKKTRRVITPPKLPIWAHTDFKPPRPMGSDPRTWGPETARLISDAEYRRVWIGRNHRRRVEWKRIAKACIKAGVKYAERVKRKTGYRPHRPRPGRPWQPRKPRCPKGYHGKYVVVVGGEGGNVKRWTCVRDSAVGVKTTPKPTCPQGHEARWERRSRGSGAMMWRCRPTARWRLEHGKLLRQLRGIAPQIPRLEKKLADLKRRSDEITKRLKEMGTTPETPVIDVITPWRRKKPGRPR